MLAGSAIAQTPTKPATITPAAPAPLPALPGASTIVPTYTAVDATTLVAVIRSQTQAQVTADNSDPAGPVVKVQQTNGVGYAVIMNDCQNGLCKSLEFHALLPAGTLNFSQVNSFNQNMRYATAFFGEKGVPELRMDLSLRGGVTAETIAYTVRIFSKVLADYIAQAQPESLVKPK
ncbi:MAG TPA: YbjN domain-containing protein [Alphaproteobacteria bacterium]|nr:YbjN domain-containing protein [Alphaproteobacteria bacterium]